MVYLQPSIEVAGIRIDEPVTMLTDLLVSGICVYGYIWLYNKPRQNIVHTLLMYYFLSMAIATFVGGVIGHGFFYLFSFEWKLPGWLTSMISIALIERAAILYSRKLINPAIATFFIRLNLIELVIFLTITFFTLDFFYVEVHAAYGLILVVTSFSLVTYIKTLSKGSFRFMIAVAFSGIGALIFSCKLGIGPWLNHIDISHLFLALSAWYFYRGSKLIIFDPLSYPDKK